jgi:splicing factor 3B subunit 2
VKDSKPGFLSAQLREALGMTEHAPPPYLINMQRYGPPPSYPSLKIPGLNAPLPPGAIYGYQAGGWGKPPVDEYGRPIYGDVFGVLKNNEDPYHDANIDKKSRWGELIITQQEEEDAEEEDEASEEEEEEEDQPQKKARTQVSGTETPMTLDGMSSVATGLETPGIIDLRKRSGIETPNSMYTDVQPRDLYKVIPQKDVGHGNNNQLFDSERTYAFSEGNENGNDKSKDTDVGSTAGTQEANGKKKRRLDSSASVQKLKDFKF